MQKNLRITIFVGLICLVIGISGGVAISEIRSSIQASRKQEVVTQNSDVLGIYDLSKLPQVNNIPSSGISVGSPYDYTMKILDDDTPQESLTLSVKELPNWLFLDGFKFFGTPTASDIGTYKIECVISDGVNDVLYDFYIVVYE